MKKFTKLESFGLIAAILVGGSYFYMKKVYDPEAASLVRARKKLQSTIREYNEIGDPPNNAGIERQIKKLREKEKKLEEELKEAGGRTEAASEITEALAELSQVAAQSNMRVLELTLGEEKKSELFTWRSVQVRLQGQFTDFVSFTHYLKVLDRPIQLHDMTMDHTNNDFSDVTVSAVLWI